jgi:hypothetical protein
MGSAPMRPHLPVHRISLPDRVSLPTEDAVMIETFAFLAMFMLQIVVGSVLGPAFSEPTEYGLGPA